MTKLNQLTKGIIIGAGIVLIPGSSIILACYLVKKYLDRNK